MQLWTTLHVKTDMAAPPNLALWLRIGELDVRYKGLLTAGWSHPCHPTSLVGVHVRGARGWPVLDFVPNFDESIRFPSPSSDGNWQSRKPMMDFYYKCVLTRDSDGTGHLFLYRSIVRCHVGVNVSAYVSSNVG